MNRHLLLCFLIVTITMQGLLRAQPAPPSTQPALDYYSGPRQLSLFPLGNGTVRVKITLNTDVSGVSNWTEAESLLNGLSWQLPGARPNLVFTSIGIADKGRLRAEGAHSVLADLSLMADQQPQAVFEDLYKQAQAAPPPQPNVPPGQFGVPGRVADESGRGRGVVGGAVGRGGGAGRRGPGYDPSMPAFLELLQPKIDELEKLTIQRLNTLVSSEPQMSPQQRNQRLDEIHAQLNSLSRKMDVLAQLSRAQPDAAARVAEKLRHFREREQDLQMKLSAQEARRIALEKGLGDLTNQVQSQRKDDPKIDFLTTDMESKQKIFQLKSQQVKNGIISVVEGAEAEAAFKQAKAALAVAEAESAKGGRGELMDKLANELTMVSIDTTDLQIQLKQLHDMMSKYDPAALDAANLNALLEGEPGFGGAETEKLPPLYYELQKQSNDLRREELVLIVDDVSIVTETQPQP